MASRFLHCFFSIYIQKKWFFLPIIAHLRIYTKEAAWFQNFYIASLVLFTKKLVLCCNNCTLAFFYALRSSLNPVSGYYLDQYSWTTLTLSHICNYIFTKSTTPYRLKFCISFLIECSLNNQQSYLGMEGNFFKSHLGEITHLGTKYDYCSLMHYGSHAFSKVKKKIEVT